MYLFLDEFLVLKSILTSRNSSCTLSIILSIVNFEAADEIMAEAQNQSREVKMHFKTRNLSEKK